MLKRWGVGLVLGLGFAWGGALAQLPGEENEPTPEYLDAAFSAEDAARVAAGFSETITNTDASGDPVGGMTDAADLVFRGRVLSQTYEYDDRGTPSTHTLLSIDERMKGNHPEAQITLVQPGGPSRTNPDRIMMVSDAHYFNLGEEELLFLELDSGNPVEALRATVMSRFRIFEDRVYNADGHGINLVAAEEGEGYRLEQSTRRNPDQRFKRIRIGSRWLNKAFQGSPRGRDGTGGPEVEARLATDAPTAQGAEVSVFSERIRNRGGVQ